MENKVSAKEYLLCNLILALLGAATVFAGILEISLFVLMPAVLTYMFARFDLKRMILPIIIVVALPSLISADINIVPAVIAFPMALMLGFAIKRRHSLLKTVSFGVIGQMISIVIALFVFHMNSGDAIAYLNGMIEQAIADVGEVYAIAGDYQALLREMFGLFLPSIFICIMASVSYLVFYITIAILKKRDSSYIGVYKPFSEIKADKTCAVAGVICFAASMFVDGIVTQTLVNIVVILMFFMFACGVSSMAYTVKRIKNKLGKILAYIVLALTTLTGSSVFVFIGLVDAFVNIRKIEKKV